MSSSIEGRPEMLGLWVNNRVVRAPVPETMWGEPIGRAEAGRAITAARGVRATSRSLPESRAASPGLWGPVDPHLEPQLQYQKRPELLVMVLSHAAVLIEQAA